MKRWFAVLVSTLLGCAGARPATAPSQLTVVVSGEGRSVEGVRESLTGPVDLPVGVRVATAPNMPASAYGSADVDASLAQARQAYVNGQFDACLHALGGEQAVVDLLRRARRDVAARFLFWRVACDVGAGSSAEALGAARDFAALGLDVPPDVATASPEVEATIAQAAHEVGQKGTIALRVTADADAVSVSLDGRTRACVTPCSLSVAAGEHVVAIEADGIVPDARRTVVDAAHAQIAFVTVPASPDLAAQQWTARYAHSPRLDSSPSVRLLALAVRAPRLALLSVDTGQTVRLRGVLAIDGTVTARAERAGSERGAPVEVIGLLRDLLVRGKIVEPAPRLYERPLFWIAVGVVAAGAAIGTYFLVRPPEHTSQVSF